MSDDAPQPPSADATPDAPGNHPPATDVPPGAGDPDADGPEVLDEGTPEGEEGAGGAEGARRRSARLAEENLILKRAVAIQNARQQEHGELQRQLLELQRACAGYQEQLQAAQRQNYSLGVHLKEALSPQVPSHRNPDVF